MAEEWPSTIEKPSYPLVKTPQFSTHILSYGSKAEQRIARYSEVRYNFALQWEVLSQEDADEIMQFFIDRKGSQELFYWANPEEAYGYPAWQVNTAYGVGDIRRPVTSTGRSYICSASGVSSSGSEPSWPTSVSGTVADGGATWTENSYIVRFSADNLNQEYFSYQLYNLNEVSFIEVAE